MFKRLLMGSKDRASMSGAVEGGEHRIARGVPPSPSGALTEAQKRFLVAEGFVVVKNVVPHDILWPALREINRALGDRSEQTRELSSKVSNHPTICALLTNERVTAAVRSVLGNFHGGGDGQVALRFPGDNADADFQAWPNWEQHYHIDGLASVHNTVQRGEIGNFDALIGVLLGDVAEPLSGNLTLWPGSHLELQDHFRKEGFDAVKSLGVGGLPKAPFSRPPVQVVGEAGDLILCNYLTAHLVAPNVSPFIRMCVYFRVNSRVHPRPWQGHRPEAMLDAWIDWKGLRSTLAELRLEIEHGPTKQPSKREEVGLEPQPLRHSYDHNHEDGQLQEAIRRSMSQTSSNQLGRSTPTMSEEEQIRLALEMSLRER